MEPAENISKSKENLQNDSQDDLSQNGSHANSTEDLVADAAEAPKDAESEEAAAIAAAQAAEAAAQAAQAAEAAKKEKQSSADLSSNTGMPKVFRGGDHLVFIEKQEAEFSDLLKKRRELIQETNLDRSSAPPQYTQTSSRYQKLLDYVENFRHQYGQIFPGRKELLLSPLNEFGIPKFVCTHLRPTQLQYSELYDYHNCAKFVSNFLQYQPVDPPYDLPKTVKSLTATIRSQRGNALDFSMLLVSLLRGAGYDAYVVSGYASHKCIIRDESDLNYDPNNFFPFNPTFDSTENKEQKVKEKKDNKYRAKPVRTLESQYLNRQKNQQNVNPAAITSPKPEKKPETPLNKEKPDVYHGLRIHFWVLVMPGEREIIEPFFIESTTGKIFPTEHENYLGIESVFSPLNYWVNMQVCYDGLKGISFDLADNMKWEYMFPKNAVPEYINKNELNEDSENMTQDEETMNDNISLPCPWIQKLEIPAEKFNLKSPDGCFTINYKNCMLETFATYVRTDGLMKRLSLYETPLQKTDAPPVVSEIWESFDNRKDKLIRRTRKLKDKEIIECFDQGRSFGLKKHITCEYKTKEMHFYPEARADGIYLRIEKDAKIMEYYADRDDKLAYRSVRYEDNFDRDLSKIVKITEHFDPSTNSAEPGIAKRRFALREDKIYLTYHRGESRLFQAYYHFTKPTGEITSLSQFCTSYEPNPHAVTLKDRQVYALFQDQLKQEYGCLQTIKFSERELREALQLRYKEEQQTELTYTHYQPLPLSKTQADALAEAAAATVKVKGNGLDLESNIDYLSPFLLSAKDPNFISKNEAQQIRELCLKAYKDRLIERAQIMQNRGEQESAAYQQRQADYVKRQETLTAEEVEAYKQFCSDTLFRIHILEKRLNKHKEAAPERYMTLDRKLKQDPRLARHLGGAFQ